MLISKNKKAFTLIELLVAIVVIGILLSISLISIQRHREKARDIKRVSDIRQIQAALDLYYNRTREYPLEITSTIAYGDDIYLSTYPTAPNPPDGNCSEEENNYSYQVLGSKNESYSISFCLGNYTSNLSAGLKMAVPGGIRNWVCGNILSDSRDGKNYETVQVGNQCWMAENLNIGTRIVGTVDSTDNGVIEKYCYDDLENNCDSYGGFYQWDEAMQYTTSTPNQGICPAGWHIVSIDEMLTLKSFLEANSEHWCGGSYVVHAKSIAADFSSWIYTDISCRPGNDPASNNSTGLNIYPTGALFNYGSYFSLYNSGSLWLSDYYNLSDSYYFSIGHTTYRISDTFGYLDKTIGFSIRCIKDE